MSGGFLRRIRALWPIALALAAGVAPVLAHGQTDRQRDVRDEWRDPDTPRPRGYALLRAQMLLAHNRARAAVGTPPLVWSDDLADEAEDYARALARARIFGHSDKATRARPEGENLWMGSSGAFTYAEMAASWVNERRYYRPKAVIPDISTTGDWRDAGHYAQVIWRGTTTVGCGVAANSDTEYLVCRYAPPGNVYGRNATAGE